MMIIGDKDRRGVIMKMMESMMVREIMKMLTSIEKHYGVGGGAYNGSSPLPRGFNVKEREERKREREIERERTIPFFFIHSP